MELSDYWRVLRRAWRTIVVAAVLGLLVAGAVSMAIKPTFTVRTQLFVATQSSGSVQDLQSGNSFSQARVQSYIETVETPAVLQPVIDGLGLDVSPSELAETVDAHADLNTVLITITAEDSSPAGAARVAQATADSLVQTVDNLERPSDGGDSPVRLSVITPAAAPTTPSAPDVPFYLALGLVAGLTLGVAVALLRATMDTRVRSERDLRRVSDAPVLGGIFFDADAQRKPLLTQAPPQGPRAESFRQIRTNLQFAHVSHKSKAVLVTSSLPGEGKTTTATNLAIAIAQGGQSVVLVDADLRRPRVDEYLGLERNAGLTTALVGRAEVEDLLQPWGPDELYVLTAGQIPPNPSELLGSDAMKQLITGLEQKFDAVIIDAPPLLPVTDAAVLAQQVGGVVLVIGSSKVKLPDLQKSLGSLEMVNADLLGVVINLLPSKGPDAYAYAYGYYSYDSEAPSALEDTHQVTRRSTGNSSSDIDERVIGVSSQSA
ncbi:polysaccharide biosynthesis tyrosine autokinase [Arthrobacter sp. L77]|uniref:polysaccharide biosynthesis tyrosine autokinase n=1 Tax=Arthrobacter sp. L77 TaxID=1496689 RepID=UPI0009E32A9B|nr:polysaccharide biosynthesis tyrosine autokinase [Arthrobacter sp. L77]